MTESMKKKIEEIDEYISALDSVIEQNDSKKGEPLIEEIVAVYEIEIKGIKNELHTYNWAYDYGNADDTIHDARILRSKLKNYKTNLIANIVPNNVSGKGISISQNVNQSLSSKIEITLDNTISIVNNIPSDILSDEEKEILNGKLSGISVEKDKGKRWEKIKSTLKWIAEKGIEVGTVALPYIVKMLERNG